MTQEQRVYDYLVPQNYHAYSEVEHDRWNRLVKRQVEILRNRAFQPFMDGLEELGILAERIPNFAELSDILMGKTRWRIVGAPGLVVDPLFFEELANRRFPATITLRSEKEFGYIEAPDIFHDTFGHVPLLIHPEFADYLEIYGKNAQKAKGKHLEYLARLYWFTVEFGLVHTGAGMRIYGSGIVSSGGETVYALSEKPRVVAFDLKRIMRTKFYRHDYQKLYFAVPSIEELMEATQRDFDDIYEELDGMEDIEVGAFCEGDHILQKGTIEV